MYFTFKQIKRTEMDLKIKIQWKGNLFTTENTSRPPYMYVCTGRFSKHFTVINTFNRIGILIQIPLIL